MTYARIYFYDVFGHWAEESIMWGANTVKLLNGYDDGSFVPDGDISRSEYVSLLYRTAEKQEMIKDTDKKSGTSNQKLESEDIGYLDLEYGHWAYDHISKVISFTDNKSYDIKFKDIFPGDYFFPNKKITREEAAALTFFFSSSPIDSENITFGDIDNNYNYYSQIMSLARNKIITGNPDGTFSPLNNITRAEAVTIIKRLYKDMEYEKKSYLEDIKLVGDNNTTTTKYPLFGSYNANSKLNTNDLLYKRAIDTLEYKSLVGIIPFEEQHLYDSDPMKTIEELKAKKYSNIIGLNYYLIKNDSSTYSNKAQLVDEIFASYANGAEVSDDELQLILNEFSDLAENIDIMLKALERWESTASSEEVRNNAIFMKSKAYLIDGKANEAIKLYEGMNSLNAKIRVMQLMNQSHILITLNEYDSAEKILREGWGQVKKLNDYINYSRIYDEQFIGAIKKVLSLKQN